MLILSFIVSGMTCADSAENVRRALVRLDGVRQVGVTLSPAVASVVVDLGRVTPAQIESAISQLGYSTNVCLTNHEERTVS